MPVKKFTDIIDFIHSQDIIDFNRIASLLVESYK